MNTITDWPLSLEQFEALPEADPHLEFDECAIQGPTVSQKMSPTYTHQSIELWVTNWLNAQGRGRALHELRVRTGRRSLVPDVSYWPTELIPREADGRPQEIPLEPPTLAIEIRSPRESLSKLQTKCRTFVSEGSRVALLIDPTVETLTVSLYARRFRGELTTDTVQAPAMLELQELELRLPLAELVASLSS